jgi:hypothetical protein
MIDFVLKTAMNVVAMLTLGHFKAHGIAWFVAGSVLGAISMTFNFGINKVD